MSLTNSKITALGSVVCNKSYLKECNIKEGATSNALKRA